MYLPTVLKSLLTQILGVFAAIMMVLSVYPVSFALATNGPEEQACEIEGHKYDAKGKPTDELWTIGLMKVIDIEDNVTSVDLALDETDKDGYYCLEWDGISNTTVIEKPYTLTYRVFEIMKEGWNYLSVEEGADADNLNVVADEDIEVKDGRVSVQIGEENGYIYANAAHHVDFYNNEDTDGGNNGGGDGENGNEGTDGDGNGGNGGSNRNSTSGTRIKRAPAGEVISASTTTPAGKVLGEATAVMPAGAPNTGAGGTAPVQVSLPTLVAILSTNTRRIK